MTGLVNGSQLSVSAYPVAWRVEVVDEDIHRGFEYVRSEQHPNHPTRSAH